ncbi:GNAT family N-acetyltransferase [Notoacmeibacter sp. MSK16QG-6]|uniref:GNAT family N-acetyltransferase n=1 Tax=Notoacmeibacter sp. MSK16QG-6 TaxID=2957982 RepID=UPI0020A179B8|nr:GNAT family N-acetyltransferase [Notoacmeibacter sp. MSK16QG-6]MCP1197971.1 GNAT family N-acetyltransferase [Notoacmeibacter sp. MSK16QG-6]
MRLRPPAPFDASHDVAHFFSGEEPLDHWLKERALGNQRDRFTRTFVVADQSKRVVGYYSLSAGVILRKELPRRLAIHGSPTTIPVALLARLAVDLSMQGKGLGRALLADAIRKILLAAENVAFRAIMVDALNDQARSFYLRLGFVETRFDPLKLVLPLQDAIQSLNEKP